METYTKLSEIAGPCGLQVGQTPDLDLFRAVRVAELAVLRATGMSTAGPANTWDAGDRVPLFYSIQVGSATGRDPYLVRWSGGFEAPEVQPSSADLIPGATYVTAPDDLVLAAATLACRVIKKQCGGGVEDAFSQRSGSSDALVTEAKNLLSPERFRRVRMATTLPGGWLAPTWPVNEARVFRYHPTFDRFFYDADQDPDAPISETDYTGTNALDEVTEVIIHPETGLISFPNPLPVSVRP